jgi:hypothetical protein
VNYGTVGNFEGTVANHKETVAFKMATDWLKTEKNTDYGDVAKAIGITRSRLQMLRMFRTRIKNQEVGKLLSIYPDVANFFEKLKQDGTSYENQTLNEPMGTHFYGKSTDHRDELIDLQKKLIARLEAELEEVKGKLKEVEGQNKVLVEIVSQRK